MTVKKYGNSRYWGVYDAAGELICVTVYKKGAQEVVRRLTHAIQPIEAKRELKLTK